MEQKVSTSGRELKEEERTRFIYIMIIIRQGIMDGIRMSKSKMIEHNRTKAQYGGEGWQFLNVTKGSKVILTYLIRSLGRDIRTFVKTGSQRRSNER